ncbi:hypothetical protein FPQ10_06295 [Allobacillus sp. SKP2-8]|uniref:hypothetical protein n=1 Tax=unclassified Allobacillus TaxID=2628859 RepID=UPI001182D31B|nr:hypothetical protein [Allobacillus sp. SKP2-8]TSJ66867.1 hypothetical protein FPQ10_06295 [Allobacillus sp. SKP2-8]
MEIILLVILYALLGLSLYFIWKAINFERDKNIKLAIGLSAITFGLLIAIPFIMIPRFNGYFWLTFLSFFIFLIVLLIINIKTVPKWDEFISLTLKIFEYYLIIFAFFFINSFTSIEEQLRKLPNFSTGLPIGIATTLYIIFVILKVLDAIVTLKVFLENKKINKN